MQGIVPVLSVLVAALALAYSLLRDRKSDISSSQAIRDKLDYISDNTRDTREDVRALDRKLDNHAERLAKVEAEVDSHEKIIQRIERS